ncbi:amidohydrolase family protein [Candidatus Poribacteria bacterium]|nr:amidohydrolase family protein [Candidatus Poribacteria bacterium]
MIIDIHVHAFPDKVASKAIETLENLYKVKAFSDGTITGLLKHMTGSGVDISVVLPVSTDPRQVVSINTWTSGLCKMIGEMLDDEDFVNSHNLDKIARRSFCPVVGFGTIHPDFVDYKGEIQRMKELGIKGVKFQPTFQKFYPHDDKMFPVYEELIKAGIMIIFHTGDEIQPAELIYSTPESLVRVLDVMKPVMGEYGYFVDSAEDSRTYKIIAAHMGGFRLWDRVEEYLIGREIFFGASFVFGHMDSDRAVDMMRSHGIHRILFGSDFPFSRQNVDLEYVLNSGLTDDEKKAVLSLNAVGLLNLA